MAPRRVRLRAAVVCRPSWRGGGREEGGGYDNQCGAAHKPDHAGSLCNYRDNTVFGAMQYGLDGTMWVTLLIMPCEPLPADDDYWSTFSTDHPSLTGTLPLTLGSARVPPQFYLRRGGGCNCRPVTIGCYHYPRVLGGGDVHPYPFTICWSLRHCPVIP